MLSVTGHTSFSFPWAALVRLDHENYFFNIRNVFTLFLCEAEIFFTLPLLIETSALIEDIEILRLLYNERI